MGMTPEDTRREKRHQRYVRDSGCEAWVERHREQSREYQRRYHAEHRDDPEYRERVRAAQARYRESPAAAARRAKEALELQTLREQAGRAPGRGAARR